MTDNRPAPTPVRGDLRFQSLLGQRLAHRYEAIAAEPAPEAFLALLRLADRPPTSSEPTA